MEALKTKRVLDAKEQMQEKKRKVQEEKSRLMEEAKNQFSQSRPHGTDSALGEGFSDFMKQSPLLPKPHVGGSVSMRTSPKGGALTSDLKSFDPSQLLKVKLQTSEDVPQVTQKETEEMKQAIEDHKSTSSGNKKAGSDPVSETGSKINDLNADIDIDLDDIEC